MGIFLLILSIFLIYQYVYDGYNQDILQMKDSYSEVRETYDVLKTLDKEDLLPEEIYVLDAKNDSHQITYVLQFCMYDKKIKTIKEINSGMVEDCIIITNGENEFNTYISQGFTGYTINQENDEFLLTNDSEIKSALERIGYANYQ